MVDSRAGRRLLPAASILLALLPPARMAWIVFTFGENNLSNDYVARAPVIAALLEGRYDFSRLFRDTYIGGGHSWLGLLPFYWFDARFFAWDLRAELGIGLLLAALKTMLVWRVAAAFVPPRFRWVLLPVLSALAFSVSQVSTFTFGESVLQMQLAQIAVAAGALSVAFLAGRPGLRAAGVAAAGLLASWSWGGGVLAWPVLATALFASGERRTLRWLVLPCAAALGVAQYVWYLVVAPLPSVARPGLSRPWRVFDLLGRPFANGTAFDFGPKPASIVFGAAGLLLAAAAVVAARGALRERTGALVVVGWSLLLALQIAYFRVEAAPWYAAPMTAFWLGLAVLLAAAPRPIAAAGFATIAAGLLWSNRTWEDKAFYLASRSPASAACLRDWRTAPPTCHDRIFQWGTGDAGEFGSLAEPLERHHLSVFAPRRTYLLQGDAAVGRVGLEPANDRGFFSRDGRTPGDAGDFRRLDLVLLPGATVTWRVDLPRDLTRATFETRVRAGSRDTSLARGARIWVHEAEPGTRVLVPAGARAPLTLDLRPFAGRTVTLRLAAEEARPEAMPLVFEVPRIEVAGAS